MGAALKFEIAFDEPQSIYFGDDIVRGHLSVFVSPARSVKAIFIVAKGEAEVEWEESNGRTKILYYNKECYFYKKVLLYKADRNKCLQGYEHRFDFAFSLPRSLPGSFEGMYGHVRYTVQARLKRHWHSKVSTSAMFQVHSPLDLNQSPQLSFPVEGVLEHQFWCLLCKSRPVCISLHLAQGSLVPGQDLSFSLRVANHSNVNIRELNLQLVRITTYYDSVSRVAARSTEAILARKTLEMSEVRSGTTRTWHREKFPIPAFPYNNLNGCTIITQTFFVKLRVLVRGPHLHFTMRVPVVVGNVPLRKSLVNKTNNNEPYNM